MRLTLKQSVQPMRPFVVRCGRWADAADVISPFPAYRPICCNDRVCAALPARSYGKLHRQGHDVNMLSLFVSRSPRSPTRGVAHGGAHVPAQPARALQLCAMVGCARILPALGAHFVAFRDPQLCSSHKSQLSGQVRNMKPGLTSHSPADAQLVQASLMSLHVGGHAPHETGQCKNM